MEMLQYSARLHAAPDIWIRRLKVDESGRLFRYALAEPFCRTECSAVGRKVGRYISHDSSTPGRVGGTSHRL